MKLCKTCGVEIPAERLEILPNTDTCVAHSTEDTRVGFMDFGHKTAPSLVMVNSSDKESLRKARRAFRRSR